MAYSGGVSLKRYVSILVQDKPGTLLRILLVFKKFNYNIISLSAGRLFKSGLFRIIIEYDSESANPESKNLIKIINNQINVLEI